METQTYIESLAQRAKVSSIELRTLSSATKNVALEAMARAIVERSAEIFSPPTR
jgi:gamma-glutamyl phosphate reductase